MVEPKGRNQMGRFCKVPFWSGGLVLGCVPYQQIRPPEMLYQYLCQNARRKAKGRLNAGGAKYRAKSSAK